MPKKKKAPDIIAGFAEIDKIIAEDGTGKLRTSPSDSVSKLMASDIKKFDVDSQFDITNQRMLAVRDDLTQFINANFGRMAKETVNQIASGLKDMNLALREIAASHALMSKEIADLKARMDQRWLKRLVWHFKRSWSG